VDKKCHRFVRPKHGSRNARARTESRRLLGAALTPKLLRWFRGSTAARASSSIPRGRREVRQRSPHRNSESGTGTSENDSCLMMDRSWKLNRRATAKLKIDLFIRFVHQVALHKRRVAQRIQWDGFLPIPHGHSISFGYDFKWIGRRVPHALVFKRAGSLLSLCPCDFARTIFPPRPPTGAP